MNEPVLVITASDLFAAACGCAVGVWLAVFVVLIFSKGRL